MPTTYQHRGVPFSVTRQYGDQFEIVIELDDAVPCARGCLSWQSGAPKCSSTASSRRKSGLSENADFPNAAQKRGDAGRVLGWTTARDRQGLYASGQHPGQARRSAVALRRQRLWTVGSPSNSTGVGRRHCWRGDLEAWPACQRARLADQRCSSCRSRSGYRRRRHDCRQHLNRRRSNFVSRQPHRVTLVRQHCSRGRRGHRPRSE
ncbi:hypothetical protein ACVWY5_006478 [Bradyrhizobium sp. USDA 3256]